MPFRIYSSSFTAVHLTISTVGSAADLFFCSIGTTCSELMPLTLHVMQTELQRVKHEAGGVGQMDYR